MQQQQLDLFAKNFCAEAEETQTTPFSHDPREQSWKKQLLVENESYSSRPFASLGDTSEISQEMTEDPSILHTSHFIQKPFDTEVAHKGNPKYEISCLALSLSAMLTPEQTELQKTLPPADYDHSKLYFLDPEIRKLAESSVKYRSLTWKDPLKHAEYFQILRETGLLDTNFYGHPKGVFDLKMSKIGGPLPEPSSTKNLSENLHQLTLYDVKKELAQSHYITRIRRTVAQTERTHMEGVSNLNSSRSKAEVAGFSNDISVHRAVSLMNVSQLNQ